MPKVIEVKNPNEQESGTVGTPNPRNAFIDSLAGLQTEAELPQEDVANLADESSETPAAEPEAKPQAEAAPETEPKPETEQPETVTVKVDGQEFQVPKEEVDAAGGIRAYQMEKAAAKRLQEASQYRAEAIRLYQQYQAPAQQPGPTAAPATDDAALARAIQAGSEEEAVNAIRTLRQRDFDPNQIDRLIDYRVQERIGFQTGFERFRTEYAHIVSDPDLLDWAQSLDNRYKQQANPETGQPWSSYWERYDYIGKQISRKFPTAANPMEEKRQKKASVTPLPQVQARKGPDVVDEDAPEDTQAEIARMRKERGQNPMR